MTTTIYDIAVEILREENGNLAAALQRFRPKIKGDLHRELCEQYLEKVLADIRAGERAKAAAEDRARGKEGPNRRTAKVPTADQKSAALRVMTETPESFLDARRLRDGRVIGDVPLHELPRIAAEASSKAVTFLRRGLEDAVDAIACARLADRARPTSNETRVRDAFKPGIVEQIFAESRLEAVQRMQEAMQTAHRMLTHPRVDQHDFPQIE